MLAELAKINFTQIGKIERGQINTTLSTIYIIAKALEITPAKLLTFDFKEK
jgi:transcriptional regulator with XRE-family HTH domain